MAAWIAFRNAARTPACSSSRIAAIVVPPGEVTDSRNSTGCIFSSRSCLAVPSIVWTTSVVEISRERPRRMPASIIASARSAKYAGPEPDTAVIASIACSGTLTTRPTCLRTSSASASWSSPACAPAAMPAIPSCTVEGEFGIARTTGTPSAMRASMYAVGIAAATESTVWSGESREPMSASSASMSWGLTATTTSAAPCTASAFDVVASTPCRSCSSATRSSRRLVTTMSCQPELSRPLSSASPMRPPPTIAIRGSAMGGVCLCRAQRAHGQQPARKAGKQIGARESGPLAVRCEQLGGLPAVDRSPAERAQQLHEPEVADKSVVVPAEPFEADDADRPRAEAALAGAPRRDQLTAERSKQRVRDRRHAYRPEPAQLPRCAAEQWVVSYAAEEVRVIVVEREDPAQSLGSRRRFGPEGDGSVGRLTCERELAASFDVEQRRHDAVAEGPRRIARQPRGKRERVRAARCDRE